MTPAFYSGLYACGRVKENALISPFILSLQFPVIYIAFKLGGSPVFLSYAGIMATLILAIIVKPLLKQVKLAGYNWDDIKTVFIPFVVKQPLQLLFLHCLLPTFCPKTIGNMQYYWL